ncbi:MAG TPA: IPT/TIG domain-containing protein [Phycisphaerae bacterium]|nr:IPT/TIG domain-containing protein [Phycisphaerae bacterium]
MASDQSLTLAMPVGLHPTGEDPETFYAELESRIEAQTSTASVVSIWTDPNDRYSGIYAMIKAAVRYAPTGAPGLDGTTPVTTPTLICRTWVWDYLSLQSASGGRSVPTLVVAVYSNLDEAAVRIDITVEFAANPVYADLTSDERAAAVDEFMSGDSVVLVSAGTRLGRGAQDTAHASAYRKVELSLHDAESSLLAPAFQFSVFATLGGPLVDAHPLLKLLQGPLMPAVAPVEGGTRVSFRGSGLSDSSSITFGTVAGTDLHASTDGTLLYATVPEGEEGTVDVSVDGTVYPASFSYTQDVVTTAVAAIDSFRVRVQEITERAATLLGLGELDEETQSGLYQDLDNAGETTGQVIAGRWKQSGDAALDPAVSEHLESAQAELEALLASASSAIG